MDMYDRICGIIEKLEGVDENVITKDVSLIEVMDSLNLIRLLVSVEEEFNISFEEDDISYNAFQTISDIMQHIEKTRVLS